MSSTYDRSETASRRSRLAWIGSKRPSASTDSEHAATSDIASAGLLTSARYTGCVDAHALRTLEYDKVLARLARHASFSAGTELALALQPSPALPEVLRRQRETAEARRLLQLKPRTGLAGAHDVGPLAERADRGGLLDPAELLVIASTLECARDLKSTISRLEESLPILHEVVDGIRPLTRVIDDINRSINQRAEVA